MGNDRRYIFIHKAVLERNILHTWILSWDYRYSNIESM